MPLAAITTNARPATANAPTMNQRVLRRILSDSVVMVPGFPQLLDEQRSVNREHGEREAVRGPDELPTSDHHSVHASSPASAFTTADGSASSWRNRYAARRDRNMMNAIMTKRTPNAFTRSGR